MSAPYEEVQGYRAEKGYVKSNPLNNDYYVGLWEDDPWYPAIAQCHKELSEAVPDYNILQIKNKFGGLRYYIELPRDEYGMLDNEKLKETTAIIARAERWVYEYERDRLTST